MHGKEKLTRSLASVPRSGVRVIIMVFYSAGMQGMRIIQCVWCFYASCDSEDMQTRR